MLQEKEQIRRNLHKQRDALSAMEVSVLSMRIISRVTEMAQFEAAECISCYLSWRNEVDTHQLIEFVLKQNKKVGAPVSGERGEMEHFEIQSLSNLRPGRFGILEPRDTRAIPEGEFDLVIVPGIAFDRSGYRIGSGGGYYDRFLAGISAYKIGFGYEFQLLDTLPSEFHDVRLDSIVTESAIYVG